MTNTSANNRTHNADQPTGTGTDGADSRQEGREGRISGTALSGREPALTLHMGLPGTRLDMVLGGPHPLLAELVRAMDRAAAKADHTAQPTNKASWLTNRTGS